MAVVLILLCVAALLVTSVGAIVLARSTLATPIVYSAACAASAAAFAIALQHVIATPEDSSALILPLGLPWLGAHFRIDALSALFLVIVNLGGAAASLYGLGYGRHESAPARVLPFFSAFLAAMNLVVMADDAFSFLLSWEFMSLVSWALVMAHHREPENTRAGYIYLIVASFGTLCLLLAFGLMAGPAGGYGFAEMRAAAPISGLAALILALTLLGAGSKAGLVPLHVWLPLAHPAAPSHVSALMSGVMTKVAIYGFIRIVFDLLGPPQWWWAMLLLFFGSISALIGILSALMQQDLKRLLAYSTIENIGIIFIGLGLALGFRANAMEWAAALGLTAALFHVFNHSLFKSLLFLGAGAVLNATGLRDLDKMGGLIHRMPVTAFAFLAGAVAISALPPLNGFVSEWLTFQAVLFSPEVSQWGLKVMVPTAGAMMALSAALVAACFVKVFGIAFLGRARSDVVAKAKEVDRFSLAAMLGFVALCLLAGLLPGFVIDAIAPAAELLVGARLPVQMHEQWLSIVPVAEARSSYNGLLVFAFITASASLAIVLIHRFATRSIRRSAPWDCGFPDPSPLTQYSGGSVAQPIRRVFGSLLFLAREQVEMPQPGDTGAARFRVELRDLIWETGYAPIAGIVGFAADRLNRMQFLTIRRYLSLVFLALVFLLLVLVIWL
ncbi:MAG TPA: hydrogenase 4 subunit B [Dongiaceae bacterium]|nr:hydrogenase 4 subunit B [Dongiaceae bacterium]